MIGVLPPGVGGIEAFIRHVEDDALEERRVGQDLPGPLARRNLGDQGLAGSLVVRMLDTGQSTRITAGDFFEIPRGHDAYVDGDEGAELILFAAPDHQN